MTSLVTRILRKTQERILARIDLQAIAAPTPGELSRTVESFTSSLSRQDARNRLSLDFDLLQIEALAELDPLSLAEELEALAATVARFNAASLTEILGINVRASSGLGASIDVFRDQNLALIKSMVTGQIQEVRTLLESAEVVGLRVEEISEKIKGRFDVSQSKADLLARDQTLKLNANITQARQRGAGVEKYIWTTSGDERVREEHAALEGQVFSWNDPPPSGHPGEDYQCRCTAFPVIEEFDDTTGLETGLVGAAGAVNAALGD